jgi:hypothetical protein
MGSPARAVALTAAVALACAGCGGSGKSLSGPANASKQGSAADVKVIRDWSQALAAGNVDKAASYFALPAIVQNGTPPIRLTDRGQVRGFNKLLPCGATLIETVRNGVYTEATFRLTERPGGNCGAGAGGTAATAFLIRGGKIAEWRRVDAAGQSPPAVPAPSPQQQQPTVTGPVI